MFTTADIILHGERLKAFPLRSETMQGCPLLSLLLNVLLEVWSVQGRKEGRTDKGGTEGGRQERHTNSKGKSKTAFHCRDNFLCRHNCLHRKYQRIYKNASELVSLVKSKDIKLINKGWRESATPYTCEEQTESRIIQKPLELQKHELFRYKFTQIYERPAH